MASAIAGLLSSSNANSDLDTKADLVGEYQDTILVRNSKGMNAGSTLFGLMSRLKAEPAENTEFNWFERDPVNREIYIYGSVTTGSASGSATGYTYPSGTGAAGAIPVTTDSTGDTQATAWTFLAQGHILRNQRTGEMLQVTADPSTGSVSIIRAINGGTLSGYTLTQGDTLAIVTLGKDEGALPTRASYEEPEILTNFVQTFNSTVDLTNAFKANKLRSDVAGPLKARRIQALEKIAKDVELAFLMGAKQRLTGANGYVYYTGGIKDAIDTAVPANALNGEAGSGVSYATVVAPWMQNFMTVGSDAKLALCGPQAYSAFSALANSADNGFRIMNQETVWGMNITVINTPFGELDLAFHPALKEIPSLSGWMFVVDLAHVMQKTLEPLFLEPNIQTPGQDSYMEQFRAKLGLKLRFAEAFGYAYNLQKITA